MCKICVCFFSAEHNYCMLIHQLSQEDNEFLSCWNILKQSTDSWTSIIEVATY